MLAKRNEVTDLEAQVAAFDAELANATAEAERLQQKRPDVLLTGSDEDLKAHDEAYGVAQRACERAAAKKADAEQRLAAARQQAAETEALALKAGAEEAADEAVAVLRKAFGEIRKAVAKARDRLEAAEAKINSANRRAGDAEDRVQSVAARLYAGAHLPERLISERPTNRWVYELSGVAVDQDVLPTIVVNKNDPFRGEIRWTGANRNGNGSDKVVCRKFMRREVLRHEMGRRVADLDKMLTEIEALVTIEELHDNRTPEIQWSPIVEVSNPPAPNSANTEAA